MSPDALPQLQEAVEVCLDSMEESAVLFVQPQSMPKQASHAEPANLPPGVASDSFTVRASSLPYILQGTAAAAGGIMWGGQAVARPTQRVLSDSVKKVSAKRSCRTFETDAIGCCNELTSPA